MRFQTLLLLAVVSLCTLSTQQAEAQDAPPAQKSPWLAAGLNFILPGTGYMYNGVKPLYVSVPMALGAGGLTYVENFHTFESTGKTLYETDKTAFFALFGAVFVINTGTAIDAFREAEDINANAATSEVSLRFHAQPSASGETSYQLSLGGEW